MKYLFKQTDKWAGLSTLRVDVHEAGQGVNGIKLTLHPGQWIGPFNPAQEAITGGKDKVGEPGVVELVGVTAGAYLLGIEVQPEQVVYIPLAMMFPGFYTLTVDLVAPFETYDEPAEATADPCCDS